MEVLAVVPGRQIGRFRVPAPPTAGLTGVASRVAGGESLFGTPETALHKWLADDVYDERRSESACGFRPRVGLAEGLKRELAWCRKQA